MLTPDLITQGRTFWLADPFKDEDSEDSDGEPHDIPDTYNGIETGLLGHPVMILHTLDGTTDVAVCLLTTLNCRDLEDRRYTYDYQYSHQFYIAIRPKEPPCPFLYPQLRLVHDLLLRKLGYLSIRQRYTIPLNMLEHYDRKCPHIRYQLTAESFVTVANTFAMKISRSCCDGGRCTHSLCDVRRQQIPAEPKILTAQSKPDLDTLPPSTDAKPVEKTEITRQGDSITSIGFNTLVFAGIANVVITAAEKSREVMDLQDSLLQRHSVRKGSLLSSIVGHF